METSDLDSKTVRIQFLIKQRDENKSMIRSLTDNSDKKSLYKIYWESRNGNAPGNDIVILLTDEVKENVFNIILTHFQNQKDRCDSLIEELIK
jgi:hypothetical protein